MQQRPRGGNEGGKGRGVFRVSLEVAGCLGGLSHWRKGCSARPSPSPLLGVSGELSYCRLLTLQLLPQLWLLPFKEPF